MILLLIISVDCLDNQNSVTKIKVYLIKLIIRHIINLKVTIRTLSQIIRLHRVRIEIFYNTKALQYKI